MAEQDNKQLEPMEEEDDMRDIILPALTPLEWKRFGKTLERDLTPSEKAELHEWRRQRREQRMNSGNQEK